MSAAFDHIRRDDGEHVGYLEMTDDGLFVPRDRLRRVCGDPMELEEAEALLDAVGLRMLAEDWLLDAADGGAARRVRIREITRDTVTVAPVLDDAAVALSVDLARAEVLTLPTDRLRPADG